jgi:MoaA/NifB/PqqE/SkfB family radical SAM enzyme
VKSPRRSPVTGWGDKLRLARFFTQLAVKEHVAPGLRVRPLVAELFLTDNCNLKCVSCACWRKVTRGELTEDEWRSVIDQLADYGILKANFTGGEPLLRSDAPRLMAHAHRRGIRNLHVNTNAVLLDERRLGAVLDAGVRSFNISVDGPNAEVHERVRGVAGSFAKTLANLERVFEERDRLGLRVRMNFTVMRSNIDDLPAMMRLAQGLQVQLYLNLATDRTFLFRDGQVSIETRIDSDRISAAMVQVEEVLRRNRRFVPRYAELAYLQRHFDDLLQRDLPCAESQLKVMVHSTGELGGCWGHDATANVRDTPVTQILDADAYREEHARFFRKECVGCGSNYALNLAWRPRTHVDDLLWRLGRRHLAPSPTS